MPVTVDFYYVLGSPPCHSVMLLAKNLAINLNMKPIDFEKGEQKSAEFGKINPQHTVPVIDDGGFVLPESRAILAYLVDKYAKDDVLNPKDAKKRAIVNHRLYFDIGTLYQLFLDYYCTVSETGKILPGTPEKRTKLEDSFKLLDSYLGSEDWVAGKDLTIADISLVSSVASCEACGFDLSRYPNVSKWFAKSKKTMPGYEEVMGKGCTALKEYVDNMK